MVIVVMIVMLAFCRSLRLTDFQFRIRLCPFVHQRSAVTTKPVRGGVGSAALWTLLCRILVWHFRRVFQGDFAGQLLDSLQRRSDRCFARLGPPEVVLHPAKELIGSGVRQDLIE